MLDVNKRDLIETEKQKRNTYLFRSKKNQKEIKRERQGKKRERNTQYAGMLDVSRGDLREEWCRKSREPSQSNLTILKTLEYSLSPDI